ncbi:MAG: hypothetical protein WBW31_24575 [Candidatus Sulfotelmatobacter sp.]
MTLQAAYSDLEDSRKSRVASAIIDLLYFYKTGEGRSQDIVTKMRFVVETYCTYTYPLFFDSDDSLASIIEKIRTTGEQHPACELLDELDAIHAFSQGHYRGPDSAGAASRPLDLNELTDFVRRTLKIVKAIPSPS